MGRKTSKATDQLQRVREDASRRLVRRVAAVRWELEEVERLLGEGGPWADLLPAASDLAVQVVRLLGVVGCEGRLAGLAWREEDEG